MIDSVGATTALYRQFVPSAPSYIEGSSSRALQPSEKQSSERNSETTEKTEDARPSSITPSDDGFTLTPEEEELLRELQKRDREVRRHEEAHVSAGQGLTGAPRYEYTTGPDRNRYAVNGEVSIDTAPVQGDPEATIRKMQIVIKAALAPAEPSAQDRKVAAQAQQTIAFARQELAQLERAELRASLETQQASGAALRQSQAPENQSPANINSVIAAYQTQQGQAAA